MPVCKRLVFTPELQRPEYPQLYASRLLVSAVQLFPTFCPGRSEDGRQATPHKVKARKRSIGLSCTCRFPVQRVFIVLSSTSQSQSSTLLLFMRCFGLSRELGSAISQCAVFLFLAFSRSFGFKEATKVRTCHFFLFKEKFSGMLYIVMLQNCRRAKSLAENVGGTKQQTNGYRNIIVSVPLGFSPSRTSGY